MYTKIKPLIIVLALIGIGSFLFFNKEARSPMQPSMQPAKSASLLPWPVDKTDQRQVLLKFGMYVTPDPSQNPITPPERFTGYHTGMDIEILPEERDAPVPIKTICEGKVLYNGSIEGYGGVVIQECTINNQPVSVLYGHLKPVSIKVTKSEERVKPETVIAELGDANTEETGNTRKHLHLGIHKGNHIEFLGYLDDEADLQEFIDPLPLLK